jgi:hypothetical protein
MKSLLGGVGGALLPPPPPPPQLTRARNAKASPIVLNRRETVVERMWISLYYSFLMDERA